MAITMHILRDLKALCGVAGIISAIHVYILHGSRGHGYYEHVDVNDAVGMGIVDLRPLPDVRNSVGGSNLDVFRERAKGNSTEFPSDKRSYH